jgi:peptidyl-dipeptidase A
MHTPHIAKRVPLALLAAALTAALSFAGCTHAHETSSGRPSEEVHPTTVPPRAKATPEEARQWMAQVNEELKDLWQRQATAEWIKSTYITDDTERAAAWAAEASMAYLTRAIGESMRFKDLDLDPDTARKLHLLRISTSLPAPSDAARRKVLAETASRLEGIYGKGKYCGKDGKGACRDLQQLSKVLADSRDYDALLDAWAGWRTISREMRPLFTEFVDISNQGARELGYDDVGALWRMGYDMPPAQFATEVDRLWEQVKPLYTDLHCYVRGQLARRYGKDKVPPQGAIPAHLLGNMWAQEWANVYELVEPYKGQSTLNVTAAMKKQKYDWERMVKISEDFFTSLGMNELPKSFWERSQFTKPRDRDVVCHASAWDLSYEGDMRIKMCIQPTEEDLITIHHELGHIYYYNYYHPLPVLYQAGANDGFHEAIGDALTLSITPGYLKQLGLLTTVPKDQKGLINVQMKDALEKVAFLPFGVLIDKWRWGVFDGTIPPERYNEAWWELRERYQGVKAPVARSEQDFDPGAKYHIPANVPYMRYFLARVLQFQFHRALCQAAGQQGPLHECSIYGNKEAGGRLRALLEIGASKPWPEALAALTGDSRMDGSALLEYFAPLQGWLQEQNKGQQCGW